jgi:hypothetical protein
LSKRDDFEKKGIGCHKEKTVYLRKQIMLAFKEEDVKGNKGFNEKD